MLTPRTSRFDALTDSMRAACWSRGYLAPLPWIRWYITLEVERVAERDGSSFDDAVRTITFDDAESWGKLVVDVTEEHAAGRSVKD